MKLLQTLFITVLTLQCLIAQHDNHITIGKIDTISSKILDEERALWIHVPNEAESDIFQKKTYPVVYLLDGPSHFSSVVGMIQQLSSANGNNICPKMIVVGIPNTDRTRDLTPTKGVNGHPYVDSTMVASSGGGEKFLSFIADEVFPYMDENYPTESYKMLIGHSFGGLTAIHTLIHHPEMFNSYISIDPSMWWSDKMLLNEIKAKDFSESFASKSLYLGIANTMRDGMDTLAAKQDTTFNTDHIRSILELHSVMKEKARGNFNYQGKYYPDDDHSSVPLITEYDALRFIFDFYRLKLVAEDYLDPESDIIGKICAHYEKLSNEFGKEIKPDEEFINSIGYQYLSRNILDRAESFFKLNVKNYPDSFNVYDSLGDFYAETGNKAKAIENYKKSIAINKDSYSKPKLLELQKEE